MINRWIARLVWGLALLAMSTLGCSRREEKQEETQGTQTSPLISDQAHQNGTKGFFFLPPIVAQPALEGSLDATLSPVVRVDELDPANATTLRTIATFTTTTGPGSETVRVEPGNYIVNWHAGDFALNAKLAYRIVIAVNGTTLGFADVALVSKDQLKNVNTNEYVPLVNGRTLPIKFWVAAQSKIDRCAGVTCTALDQCHVPGTCDPGSGICTNPVKADGSSCNDGNACTRSDTCRAGACTGASLMTCTASDQCHAAGTCDPSTGACSNPALHPDGTPCDDGNAYTVNDTWRDCTCAGNLELPAVPAPAPTACGSCDDANLCTFDSCVDGACVHTAVTCEALDVCHQSGTCDPATGACSTPLSTSVTCDDELSCKLGTCRQPRFEHTNLSRTPGGRALNVTYNLHGQITSTQAGADSELSFTRDPAGSVTTASTGGGTRVHTFAYDATGRLTFHRDPTGLVATNEYDADGHVSVTRRSDGSQVSYTFQGDALKTLTLPNGVVHETDYDVDGRVTAIRGNYATSASSSIAETTELHYYPGEPRLEAIVYPDRQRTKFLFDSAWRLQRVVYPEGETEILRDANGRPVGAVQGAQRVDQTWSGDYLASRVWSGTVSGAVTTSRNNLGRVESESVNGSTIAFVADADNLPSRAGAELITRNGSGAPSRITVGSLTEDRVYSSLGEWTTTTVKNGSATLLTSARTYDAGRRVIQETETVVGQTHITKYAYDAGGRLMRQDRDGTITRYAYDINGNMVGREKAGNVTVGTYDLRDRVKTFGGLTIQHDAVGALTTKTVSQSGASTSYVYDRLGRLLRVGAPNAPVVEYVYDGESHRVGKRIDGGIL